MGVFIRQISVSYMGRLRRERGSFRWQNVLCFGPDWNEDWGFISEVISGVWFMTGLWGPSITLSLILAADASVQAHKDIHILRQREDREKNIIANYSLNDHQQK